jgi:hypothetical protein
MRGLAKLRLPSRTREKQKGREQSGQHVRVARRPIVFQNYAPSTRSLCYVHQDTVNAGSLAQLPPRPTTNYIVHIKRAISQCAPNDAAFTSGATSEDGRPFGKIDDHESRLGARVTSLIAFHAQTHWAAAVSLSLAFRLRINVPKDVRLRCARTGWTVYPYIHA